MAVFTEQIKIVIDLVTKQTGLGGLKKDVAQAEGALGKLKAGAGNVGSALGKMAGPAALGAGSALVAFGIKAVGAFEDLALAASKMADATGLTVEAASELTEVSGDLGISAGTVESAIGKMNKTLAATPEALTDLGGAIVKAKDGTTDVEATFLSAVDAINSIHDPVQRAAAATKLFGKGWQESAELLALGGDKIRDLMDAVDDGKRITDREVASAKKLRDALDALRDKGEKLTLTLGGELAPALTSLAESGVEAAQGLEKVAGVVDKTNSKLKDTQGFDLFSSSWQLIGGVIEKMASGTAPWESIDKGADEAIDHTNVLAVGLDAVQTAVANIVTVSDPGAAAEEALGEAARIATGHVVALGRSFTDSSALIEGALGRLDEKQFGVNIMKAIGDVKTAADDYWKATKEGADDAAAKEAVFRDKVLETQQTLIDKLQQVNDINEAIGQIPKEKTTEILALIDQQSFAEAASEIDKLSRNRTMELSIVAKGGAGFGNGAKFFAGGGDIRSGAFGVVGEAGPEVVTSGGQSWLTTGPMLAGGPAHVTPVGRGAAGRAVTNVTVNLPSGARGSDAVREINRWHRRNGSVK